MTLKKTLEERIRGWLPKAPRGPSGESLEASINTKMSPRLKTSGVMLSYFGIALITLVIYRFLLQILNPASNVPGFQLFFIFGFVLLVAGMFLRVHSVEYNVLHFRSQTFVVGLVLLTVSVFGTAINVLQGLSSVNVTFGEYGENAIAAVIFSICGFIGWLVLSRARTTRLGMVSFSRKSFSILAAGAILNLIVAPVQVFLSYSSGWHPLPYHEPGLMFTIALFFFILLAPLGTIFLTYGWAAAFSVGTKSRKFLLLGVLGVFVGIALLLTLGSLFPTNPPIM